MEIEIIRQSVSKNVNQIDCIIREDIKNLIKLENFLYCEGKVL